MKCLSIRVRRGMSLLEVMFAIGVAAVGLVGALVILPIAGRRGQEGLVYDASDRMGRSAMSEFSIRGMGNSNNWLIFDMNSQPPGPNLSYKPYTPNHVTGGAFCIDPLFVSQHVAQTTTDPKVQYFPYESPDVTGEARMRRITLRQTPVAQQIHEAQILQLLGANPTPTPPPIQPMSVLTAESIFMGQDDPLTSLNPGDRTQLPDGVMGPYTTGGQGADGAWGVAGVDDNGDGEVDNELEAWWPGSDDVATQRQYKGDFSWMATLAPKVGGGDQYVLSIVLFHQRDYSMTLHEPEPANPRDKRHPDNERILNAHFNAVDGSGATEAFSGLGGGLVRLQLRDDTRPPEDLEIRRNQWVMLCGVGHQPVFKWYRVVDVEKELTPNGAVFDRLVSLQGPDWDVRIPTQAVLVNNVVGVHEKTISLETASLWAN